MRIISTVLLICLSTVLTAQIEYKGSFGKGIRFKTQDESFALKFGVRIQPRWDYVYNENTKDFQQQAWVARSRLKFDGHVMNPNIRYKIEFDVVGGYVRDAMIKYRFAKHSDIWFGQGKLPGNRERVVSSGNLQFVNRSIYNNGFNIDRDVGIQFHHYFELGDNFIIRDMYALSTGNGIRNKRFKPNPSFTGKIEILPFGFFEGKGDYVNADIKREKTLKMALAFSADYNMDAYKSHSHIGLILDDNRDLLTLSADIHLKYQGWSFMGEWGSRSAHDGTALVYDDSEVATQAYYTGWGLNAQMGYLFKSNWEIAGRYSFVKPEQLIDLRGAPVSFYNDMTDHTLCVSKYFVGHKLKIQGDITYRDHVNNDNMILGRLQMELHF